TSSGLVKRTPRIIDTGEVRAVGLPTDDDLLDVLGRYATPSGTGRHDTRNDPTRAGTGRHDTRNDPTPAGLPGSPPRPTTPRTPAPLTPLVTPAPRGAGAGGGPTPADTDPTGGGVTGELTRRVRGAQLPSASPLSIRRGRGSADGDPGPAVADAPRPRPGPVSPDDSLFEFLSTFTAGVQRGLDTQRDDEVEPPRR
ncbi:MAG: hypothetical protein PV358_18340, partial [Acidimicrobiales bacterium]|nr:hypothetical protein [Acidimicrobiales bacterium]